MPPVPVTYVVGSSHSGSTLLAFLADQHPDVASVGETAVKRRIRREGRASSQRCSCGATLVECGFWRDIFRDVSSSGIRFDAEHWSTDYRFEAAWLDAVLTRETSWFALRRARRWATRLVPGLRQRMARVDAANVAFVHAVLARTGARVFFDTTKLLTRLTYLVELPALQVTVVRLVRDARGVAASAKRRGDSALEATSVWLNDQRAIDRALAESSVPSPLTVRYEDLCEQPAATLTRLWQHCGVEPVDVSRSVTPRAHHVLGNSMRMGESVEVRLDDAWRRGLLGADDERAVWRVAGAMNERLGYAR
jgi:hypothetical protein